MARPDAGIAQGLDQEALADAGWAHQQHMLVLVEELQGEDGTPGWNGQKYTVLPGRNKPGFPATP